MRKLHIVGVASLAMLVLGMLTVASASGAISTLLAEWLEGGVGVAEKTELLVESSGELTLTDLEALTPINTTVEASVKCSGILVGWVGYNGSDLITELLSLGGGSISQTKLVAPELLCTNVKECPEPLVWAVDLPWKTLLELVVQGTEEFFAVLISEDGKGSPGWAVLCHTIAGEIEDTCTAETGVAQATNEASTVDATFSEAFTELVELKLATCTDADKPETGVVAGLGVISDTEGLSLQVSE